MSPYTLRTGIKCCVANHHAAFLDVLADRYFGLPEKCEKAFFAIAMTGTVSADMRGDLAPLINMGILIESASDTFPLPERLLPDVTQSALDLPRPRPPVLSLVAALLVQTWTAASLKRASLSELLTEIEKRKTRSRKAVRLPPVHAISAFLATRRYMTTQDQCLRWSLSMINYLAGYRSFPQLVIGVRMTPFSAHAWVQFDDIVLNDHVDQVRLYTPILVL